MMIRVGFTFVSTGKPSNGPKSKRSLLTLKTETGSHFMCRAYLSKLLYGLI
jgi:hypothetical protein